MLAAANYAVELRLDGVLIGNVRELAQGLTWKKQRTQCGVDAINFTLNDVLFARWCADRGFSLADVLRPLALDCRVVRNGVPVVGGFLATMPAYSPKGNCADLKLKFDGYLNLLAGVFIRPQATNSGKMGELVRDWIMMAENRATTAGKGFGFVAGSISEMAVVQQSFDNYKSVKDVIADRCDNTSGAGMFEVYFHPDRKFDVIRDADFGREIVDYVVQYPTRLNGVAATSISAKEISGFASCVIGIGSGDVSDDENGDALTSIQIDADAVAKYGYAESVLQESSVSVQETLDRNVAKELAASCSIEWQPQIKLNGRHVAPMPVGDRTIWIGDVITIDNTEDMTGMTVGQFRVNSLNVAVQATGAEEITPELSRGAVVKKSSFARDMVRMKNELLALKTKRRIA